MFSITPAMRWWVCTAIAPARSATSEEASWGVVTTISSASGTSCPTEIATSPVPGGRSISSTSRSPQYTSARNCSSARCRIGPRHGTGSLPFVNIPTEMTFTPCADGGMIISSTWVGRPVTPSMRGTEWPYMSASSTPTFCPAAASAAARLTVTEDFPTPPLPLATAYTRVSEESLANGISRSWRPPRSWLCRPRRCSSLITSSSTRTAATPGSSLTAPVTARVMVSRIGQPATVSHTSTRIVPSSPTCTFLTMPSSVIGRWISGSLTPDSAWVTCSTVGGDETADGDAMTPCYEPPGASSNGRCRFRAAGHGIRSRHRRFPASPQAETAAHGASADRPPAPGGPTGQGHPAQPHRHPPADVHRRGTVRAQHRAGDRGAAGHLPVVPGGRVLRRGADPQRRARGAGAPGLPDLGQDAGAAGGTAGPGWPAVDSPAAGLEPGRHQAGRTCPRPGGRRDRDTRQSRHADPDAGRVLRRLPGADQPPDQADSPEGAPRQPGHEPQGTRARFRPGGRRRGLAG